MTGYAGYGLGTGMADAGCPLRGDSIRRSTSRSRRRPPACREEATALLAETANCCAGDSAASLKALIGAARPSQPLVPFVDPPGRARREGRHRVHRHRGGAHRLDMEWGQRVAVPGACCTTATATSATAAASATASKETSAGARAGSTLPQRTRRRPCLYGHPHRIRLVQQALPLRRSRLGDPHGHPRHASPSRGDHRPLLILQRPGSPRPQTSPTSSLWCYSAYHPLSHDFPLPVVVQCCATNRRPTPYDKKVVVDRSSRRSQSVQRRFPSSPSCYTSSCLRSK